MPRKLATLEETWEELVFTQNALELDPSTRDLAPTVEPLLGRWEDAAKTRRQARRAVLKAQAGFSDMNYRADHGVLELAADLEHTDRNRDRTRYNRYFAMAPSRLVRRALGSMITRMKGWIPGLRAEPEPAISRHADILEKLANEADGIINVLATARGAASDVRVKVVEDFLADVDAFRMDLHGELVKRAAANRRGREFVAKFFRPARNEIQTAAEPEPAKPAE